MRNVVAIESATGTEVMSPSATSVCSSATWREYVSLRGSARAPAPSFAHVRPLLFAYSAALQFMEKGGCADHVAWPRMLLLRLFLSSFAEAEKPMMHHIRVDIEMPGMIESTFDTPLRVELKKSLCTVLNVPRSTVRLEKLTEWDLRLVAQYQIDVLSAPAVDRIFHRIASKTFKTDVTALLVVSAKPEKAGRLMEVFSRMVVSKPMLLGSHDDHEVDFVNEVIHQERLFLWILLGVFAGAVLDLLRRCQPKLQRALLYRTHSPVPLP